MATKAADGNEGQMVANSDELRAMMHQVSHS